MGEGGGGGLRSVLDCDGVCERERERERERDSECVCLPNGC